MMRTDTALAAGLTKHLILAFNDKTAVRIIGAYEAVDAFEIATKVTRRIRDEVAR